ncbi:hypothetical protein [Paenibacillus sp. 843]|uniref:hypothetical protein n=1 Tax=Paenibacillus sp. 843 TaxID=3341795 RepID=UPI00372D3F7F
MQPDGFTYLARTLIGQQLSVKAAGTIFQRIECLCGGITPDSFLSVAEESLRSAGSGASKGLGYAYARAALEAGDLFGKKWLSNIRKAL